MNKQISLLLYITLFISTTITAQETTPVQFRFNATRLNDSTVALTIATVLAPATQLFSVVPPSADNAFVSSLTLDSSCHAAIASTPPITETGKVQLTTQPDKTVLKLFADSVTFTYTIKTANATNALKGNFNWLAKQGDNFPSGEAAFNVSIPLTSNSLAVGNTAATTSSNSLWHIFLLTLATGLLAIITPCVFPLIPVTVSFFLKRSKSKSEGLKNALTYSISIILIYTIPTLVLTLLFGDKILYHIATSPISNLCFFAIFILFATSFFGAFELALPNSWANKADEKASKGGISGIFFMALTLVIVSFSCTGPIVGTLLGQTSTQGFKLAPIIGMLGFGVGLALPFSLFAFFPTMLQSLPKSGGWLNSVKVVFGFIELALAMKFLSNVDLAYHWHLLDRDVFLVFWIVIFTLLGFYLLGKLSFSHDSPIKYVSVPRLFFAIAAFSFSLHMVPGLWGAPLRLLSGFIPPTTTQDFNLDELKYSLINTTPTSVKNATANPPKKYANKLKAPFGIAAYFDLEEGIAAANAVNKPIMLDFTGHSCANCRKMEEEVWKNPEILKTIKEDFVVVSLYVDESTELPLTEQYTNARNERITTVGEKNLDYEITKFGFNAQPLYMFLDLKGNPISNIKFGYNSNKQSFATHLSNIKSRFAQIK